MTDWLEGGRRVVEKGGRERERGGRKERGRRKEGGTETLKANTLPFSPVGKGIHSNLSTHVTHKHTGVRL